MKVLGEFPSKATAFKKYDWKTLFDGKVYELTAGEDFHCKPNSFAQLAYKVAKARAIKVRSNIAETTVTIQALKDVRP